MVLFHPGIDYNVGGISKGYGGGPYVRTRIEEATERLAEARGRDLPPAGRRDAQRGTKEQSACIRRSTPTASWAVNDKATRKWSVSIRSWIYRR